MKPKVRATRLFPTSKGESCYASILQLSLSFYNREIKNSAGGDAISFVTRQRVHINKQEYPRNRYSVT